MSKSILVVSVLALSLAACAKHDDAMMADDDAMMSDSMMSDTAKEGEAMMSDSMMADG